MMAPPLIMCKLFHRKVGDVPWVQTAVRTGLERKRTLPKLVGINDNIET